MVHIIDTVASSAWRSQDPRSTNVFTLPSNESFSLRLPLLATREITRPVCYLDLAAFAAADIILIPKRLSASTMSFM
jgi:hypothetical protein